MLAKQLKKDTANKKIVEQLAKEIGQINLHAPFGLNSARLALERIDASIKKISKSYKIPQDKEFIITENTLIAALPVLIKHRPNQKFETAKRLFDIWIEQSKVLPAAKEDEQRRSAYLAALIERVRDEKKSSEGCIIIQRFRAMLDLSQDALGQMFKVSGETIRRWEQKKVEIPEDKLAELRAADAALSHLLSIFLPDRLPTVIRQPAEIFKGQRALDWILQGRIKDVADQYDALTRYQL